MMATPNNSLCNHYEVEQFWRILLCCFGFCYFLILKKRYFFDDFSNRITEISDQRVVSFSEVNYWSMAYGLEMPRTAKIPHIPCE